MSLSQMSTWKEISLMVPFGFSQSQIGMELLNELSSIVRDLTECFDFLRSIGEIFRRGR